MAQQAICLPLGRMYPFGHFLQLGDRQTAEFRRQPAHGSLQLSWDAVYELEMHPCHLRLKLLEASQAIDQRTGAILDPQRVVDVPCKPVIVFNGGDIVGVGDPEMGGLLTQSGEKCTDFLPVFRIVPQTKQPVILQIQPTFELLLHLFVIDGNGRVGRWQHGNPVSFELETGFPPMGHLGLSRPVPGAHGLLVDALQDPSSYPHAHPAFAVEQILLLLAGAVKHRF
ncbi:hypothetical protein D3C80_1238940 [compost metagenome]